jgi:hypothetical protein
MAPMTREAILLATTILSHPPLPPWRPKPKCTCEPYRSGAADMIEIGNECPAHPRGRKRA